jgi:(2Fe-2S) ferredoxin
MPAKLYYIDGVKWPVLIVSAEGILYPRATPENIPAG